MLEILQFYVSDFGVWLGITIGMGVVALGLAGLFHSTRGGK